MTRIEYVFRLTMSYHTINSIFSSSIVSAAVLSLTTNIKEFKLSDTVLSGHPVSNGLFVLSPIRIKRSLKA